MTTPKVTLYTVPGSCAIVAHMLLHQAGIPFTLAPVLRKDLTTTYAKINPKKQVPALVVDGVLITENPAIAQRINQLGPNAQIMGRDPTHFIRVCEWLNWLSGSIHAQTWGPYVRPYRFTTDPSAEDGIKAKAVEKLLEKFDMIESRLPDEGWAVGDTFTAVDAYLLPFAQWAQGLVETNFNGKYPRWARLVQRVEGLESVQRALTEESKIREEQGDGALKSAEVRR